MSKLYLKYILLIGYVFSMQPWFFYGTLKSYVYEFIVAFFLLILRINSPQIFNAKIKQTGVIWLIISIIIYSLFLSFNSFFAYIPTCIITYLLFKLNINLRSEIVFFITKGMAYIIGISLIMHIMTLIFDIPHTKFYPADGSYSEGLDNYYINIISGWMPYTRFQSIFIEPGHLIMGIIPLIFINKMDLRNKYVFTLILATLFSLSLAGYIYIIVIFLYYSIIDKKSYKIILNMLFILFIYCGFTYYINNYSDSSIKLAIVDRLKIEDGDIVGNNRVTEEVDAIFDKVITTPDILLGTDYHDRIIKSGGNQGIKVIIIRLGIIPIIFICIAFWKVLNKYKTIDHKFMFLLTLIMISQNFYPFWISMITNLSIGATFLYNKEITNK